MTVQGCDPVCDAVSEIDIVAALVLALVHVEDNTPVEEFIVRHVGTPLME